MEGGRVPVVDMLRSLPNVGVEAALCRVMEGMEEELSARARGARGGGLPETGGLKGRDWREYTTVDYRQMLSIMKGRTNVAITFI